MFEYAIVLLRVLVYVGSNASTGVEIRTIIAGMCARCQSVGAAGLNT